MREHINGAIIQEDLPIEKTVYDKSGGSRYQDFFMYLQFYACLLQKTEYNRVWGN